MTTDRERMEHLLKGFITYIKDNMDEYLGGEISIPQPEWYETIVENNPDTRILCVVYDEDTNTEALDLIIRYDTNNDKELLFEGTNSWYTTARPATLEEVKKYIYASR